MDFLGPDIFQKWMYSKVVQEPLPPGNGYWCFLFLVLVGLLTTVLGPVLSCQCGSGCYQHSGRVFLLPKQSDSRKLPGLFPNPGLRY